MECNIVLPISLKRLSHRNESLLHQILNNEKAKETKKIKSEQMIAIQHFFLFVVYRDDTELF